MNRIGKKTFGALLILVFLLIIGVRSVFNLISQRKHDNAVRSRLEARGLRLEYSYSAVPAWIASTFSIDRTLFEHPFGIYLVDGHDGQLLASDMRLIAELPTIERIRINGARFATADFEALGVLEHIHYLDIASSSFGDADVGTVIKFAGLMQINISGTTVTDVGVSNLARNCLKLEDLDIGHNTNISNAALAGFDKLAPLRVLDVASTKVDNDAVAYISKLKYLVELDISYTFIDYSGVSIIATNMHGITMLGLRGLSVGLALQSINNLEMLEDLDLSDTDLSVADIVKLKQSKRLRGLHLRRKSLSQADIEYLRGVFSGCFVYF
jgi:hypothetical protein